MDIQFRCCPYHSIRIYTQFVTFISHYNHNIIPIHYIMSRKPSPPTQYSTSHCP